MSERLKGTVNIHYTVNLGNYQSIKVEASKEFWTDEDGTIHALKTLDGEMLMWMQDRGVAPTIIRAVPKDAKS